MKRTIRLLTFVVAGGALFGGALSAFDYANQVRLESHDGRYRSIRVRTDNNVRIVRKLSDASCRLGYSWGYDSNRIWVDRGCRAIFTFGRDLYDRYDRYDPYDRYERHDCCEGYRGGNGRHDRDCRGHDRYDDYRSGRMHRVRVESEDGRFRSYRAPIDGRVRLVRRLSDAPCYEGRSWGYNSGGIWVDRGCRAEFEFYSR
jgi:hypothetical protein